MSLPVGELCSQGLYRVPWVPPWAVTFVPVGDVGGGEIRVGGGHPRWSPLVMWEGVAFPLGTFGGAGSWGRGGWMIAGDDRGDDWEGLAAFFGVCRLANGERCHSPARIAGVKW